VLLSLRGAKATKQSRGVICGRGLLRFARNDGTGSPGSAVCAPAREATGAPPKSLIRMFGRRGNPQAKNLFNVIGYLQKRAGLQLHVAG
jgi:hypothetical protein